MAPKWLMQAAAASAFNTSIWEDTCRDRCLGLSIRRFAQTWPINGEGDALGGNNIFLTFLRTYVHNSRDGARSALLGEFNALVKQVLICDGMNTAINDVTLAMVSMAF